MCSLSCRINIASCRTQTHTQRKCPWSCLRAASGRSCSGQTGRRGGSAPRCVWWSAPGSGCCDGRACWRSRSPPPSPSYLRSAPTPSCRPCGATRWCLPLSPGACHGGNKYSEYSLETWIILYLPLSEQDELTCNAPWV